MPPTLQDGVEQKAKDHVLSCKERMGYPFKVVGHIGAVACCVMLGWQGIFGFISLDPLKWVFSLLACISCVLILGIECSDFFEWISNKFDCCKPVKKLYPEAVRKQLQNFLIRGCIYVVLGTAGLIVGSDKFDSDDKMDSTIWLSYLGTLICGIFFLLARCVEEEQDEMRARDYDKMASEGTKMAKVAGRAASVSDRAIVEP